MSTDVPAGLTARLDRRRFDVILANLVGNALGLAIAWENARLHGGHIHAGNHPDGGAVFTVSLPLTGGACEDLASHPARV